MDEQATQTPPVASQAPEIKPETKLSDEEQNKWIAMSAYLIFFLPLLLAKDSSFGKYHANQGLVLFLTSLAVNIIGRVIPFLGWFIILPLGSIFLLVLAILGIVNAYKGLKKPLPGIGGIEIIK